MDSWCELTFLLKATKLWRTKSALTFQPGKGYSCRKQNLLNVKGRVNNRLLLTTTSRIKEELGVTS